MNQLSENSYNKGPGQTYYAYAGYPSIKIYKKDTGNAWANHLLFGDFIIIKSLDIVNGRVKARSRNKNGWVKADEIQKQRVLEVNFVDIGQGDGCHIVTPDDQHIIVDSGETDNMNRYLTWRFYLYNKKKPLPFPFISLISHSDVDHYRGFQYIFDNKNIRFSRLYHNGLVERPGNEPLGAEEDGYITGLVQTNDEMRTLISDKNNRKGSRSTYCKTLYKALKANPDIQYKSLARKDGYVEGFEETNQVNDKEFSIKILGPVTEKINGKDALKSINNLGKDKNGHSVIIKIRYGEADILLGGDVNTEFGEILHHYYEQNNILDELRVDVAKACHHGSNHFYYQFIEDINSAATVISSGDDESYAHPRPDAIGAFGKCGYGDRPLVFSTELARSNKEITFIKLEKVANYFDSIKEKKEKIKELRNDGYANSSEEVKKLKKQITDLNKKINSFATKFGMINLRTDGKKMIIAQKYERETASGKWDIHMLEYSEDTKRFELKE
jgi:beta-lactamase superfamily II metal-dependent hydrolase